MRSLFGNLHTPSSLSPLSGQPPRRSTPGRALGWVLLCVFAGALQAVSLAWPLAAWSPPGLSHGQASGWLQIGSLAVLALALLRATRPRSAAWRAWWFATSWLSSTFWWLFVSLHTYGGLAAWLTVLAVLALAGLLALYYAIAAGLLHAWAPRRWPGQALLFAAVWTLAELARARWFTGFPWGAGGYAQVDLMAAWAPLVGVYGMGAAATFLAGVLAMVVNGFWARGHRGPSLPTRRARPPKAGAGMRWWEQGSALLAGLAVLLFLGTLFSGQGGGADGSAWGQRNTRAAGELRVWLLQGNISQDEKFVAGTGVAQAMAWYPAQMAEAVRAAKTAPDTAPDLVVAPETALPLLPQQMGAAFWQPLLGDIASGPVAALMGLPLGSFTQGYTNSAWGMDPATAAQARSAYQDPGSAATLPAAPGHDAQGFYRYDKHHLVPFGEFIPPFFRWFIDLMNIPLGDFNRGDLVQPAWQWAGQRIAPNICYEDLFGEDLAAQFRDEASAPTVLVNLSNIGWFGDTIAIDQHLQISRLRAMELGRPMLRATNTGATAAIDHRGVVTHQLPRLTRGRLEATVQGRSGLTPFAVWAGRWGLWPVWGLCGLVLALSVVARLAAGPGPRRR